MNAVRTVVYAAKCYWPGVTAHEAAEVDDRAARETADMARDGVRIRYLGSMVFPKDDLVLCLFESAARADVLVATKRAAVPCERLMESYWLESKSTRRDGQDD